MSSFSVHISTDNAAFQDLGGELARILLALVEDRSALCIDPDDHRHGANEGAVRDANGNTCGRWFWTDRDATHDDGAALDGIISHLDSLDGWEADTIEDVCEWITNTGRKLDPGTAHA